MPTVRWIELRDPAGRGLRLTFDAPNQASATHFRAADLAGATHDAELKPAAETIVHLRRRPSRSRDGQLRPRHAAGVPRRAGNLHLVVDPRGDRMRHDA